MVKKNVLIPCFIFALSFLSYAGQTEDLFDAISSGSVPRVKKELSRGTDINVRGLSGKTPLINASELGEVAIVKFLVSYDTGAGAAIDIDAVDNDGKTALIKSVIYGNSSIVKSIVDKGANLNIKDNNKKTALIYASEKGNMEIVQILNLAMSTYTSRVTDLIYKEIESDNEARVVELLENGADLNNSIIYAIQKEKDKYIKMLILKGANFSDNYFYNKKFSSEGIATPFQWACYKGDADLAEKLIKNFAADVNYLPSKGDIKKPAIIFAIESESKETVSLLIRNNARLDNDFFDKTGYYPTIIAAKKGNEDILNQVLKAGADLKVSNNEGFSPLYYAYKEAEADKKNNFETLLKYGANIDNLEGGITLLMRAVQDNNVNILNYLISKKASVNKVIESNKYYNAFYSTAIKMALGAVDKNKDIIKALFVAGAKPELSPEYESGLVIWSITEGDTEFSSFLIKNGIKVNYFDVIEKAITDVNIYMVELLIKNGLDVNLKNKDGKTPLMLACLVNDQVKASGAGCGSYEIAELLVAKGASIGEKDVGGKTAIDYCVSKRLKSFLQYSLGKTVSAADTQKKMKS